MSGTSITVAGRTITARSTFKFTGVLNNGAQAVYRPDKHNGMIVFDWGNGVKRECYCKDAAK